MRRVRRLVQAAAVVGVLFVLLYAASAPVLKAVGEQLVHSDPLERADVMIVLAPWLERLMEAADVYRQGYAPIDRKRL